jgi:endoglucanase
MNACIRILTLSILVIYSPACFAQASIRLNQIGFYPNANKIAVVTNGKPGKFYIQSASKRNVFTGDLKKSALPALSGNYTWIADFSAFKKGGKYTVYIPGTGSSYPFNVSRCVHKGAADATIRAFYFMRASIPLNQVYAGKWQRAAGHPDDKVLIHPSAASNERPESTVISSPRGWYDAGDYNKYIVNSGITTATLLSLYEDFPAYMKTVKLNIPESNNHLPDVLDEILWNLRWMLTMQDPNDGGVYHKLTNPKFDGMIMPDKAIAPRYVVQKSTTATLDFAAVMAQASRIFKKYPNELPGLADSCIKASENAWKWALVNPDLLYEQDIINSRFEPKVVTGTYGDKNVADEWFWAAAELFVTTGKDEFSQKIILSKNDKLQVPTWSDVKYLGYYTLAQNAGINAATHPVIADIKERIIQFADIFIADADKNAYQTVMTKSASNFNWGSNSNAANQGVLLIKAYKLSGNKQYLAYALSNLDYILGRNGTGYSYITGQGTKTPMHPHHRPSVADGIAEPIPGMLSGGPNPGMQDGIKPPSLVPDEAFIDDDRSYASNEVAINWNAPIAYLANAIEALQNEFR